jgi:dipeptidyl aminopeptidase/acylaminoacyl peptidase/predicted Ser/Thr protein kinase
VGGSTLAILAGKRLGPYEILSAIGAGGMGEVYRARDTRLERTVAVKILPDHLSDRAELRERFDREARTVASLNHPHICVLHDIGHQDGTDFLVMEYLEGETLAERLKKGPLPLDQVLQYAIEISDALDKAHRKGITHRDLKPGNIMLTKSGTKLLDFGLAKLRGPQGPVASLSALPTEGSNLTAQGTILGTLQYMAPEQLEGGVVDARTDIFAFGVVVYEMATGKKAFEGKSQASLIAKILETDPPPMSSLQPMTPPALDRVVKKCLAKEPEKRWQAVSDLCDEVKWISDSAFQAGMAVPSLAARKLKKRGAWAAAAVAVAVAVIAALALYWPRTPSLETHTVRFTVDPPEKGRFNPAPMFLSISPDGSKLAFVAAGASGKPQLWLRPLDSPAAQPLSGTDNPAQPFWSADSRFVAFLAEGKLKKIDVSGGSALTVADAQQLAGSGTWSGEGVILVGSATTIYRVSAVGGAVTPVTMLDAARQESVHIWPYFLPDGKHFLYLALSAKTENSGIFVSSLDSKERKLLLNASSNPVYVPPGYLLFNREGTLMAQPFDAQRLELKGEAVPVVEGVQFNPASARSAFAASNNGVLAYRGGTGRLFGGTGAPLTLTWVSRNGTEQRLAAPIHNYVMPRVSPDGQRVAAGIEEADGQIWVYDLSRDTLTRLTFDGKDNVNPVWTPDGKRIVFRGAQSRLFWQPADGSGPAEELAKSELGLTNIPGSFSPDGQVLAFMEFGSGLDLYTLSLKDGKPQPFLRTPSNETAPRFSPDGRWIAYASDESGRYEIYVRPYPGPGGKWQISTEGGTEPAWNPKGRELFYRSGDKMMAVEVTTQGTFSAGKPKMLFEGPYQPTPLTATNYDVSPDGQRFLMLKPSESAEAAPTQITVVLNWFEELKQKVPAGKN